MEKYLTFEDASSRKFWHVRTEGNKVSVTFGRIGTAGQTQEKAYPTPEAAEKEANKQAAAKLAKGYAEAVRPENAPAPKAPATVKSAPATPPAAAKPAPKSETGPSPVADDGQVKPWHSKDFWEYSWYCPDESAFAHLEEERDNPWGEDTRDKPAKKAAAAFDDVSDDELEFDEDDDEDDRQDKRREAHIAKTPPEKLLEEWRARIQQEYGGETPEECDGNVRDWLENVIADKVGWKHSYLKVDKHIQVLRMLTPDAAEYAKRIQDALSPGIEDILGASYSFDEDDQARLQWLLARGASVECKAKLPICQYFQEEYSKNPDPARTPAILAAYRARICAERTPLYAQELRAVVQGFARGEIAGGQWPKGATHLRLLPDSIGPNRAAGEKEWRKIRMEETGIESSELARELANHLPAHLQKMADAGKFSGLKGKIPSGVLAVKGYNGEMYLRHALNEAEFAAQADRMEALAESLEALTDFEAMQGLEEGVTALLEGIVLPIDLPRARALLQKYLYSLDGDAQKMANTLLERFDDYFIELQYDRALWMHQNGDFGPARRVMGWVVNKGYAPAVEKLAEFKAAEKERNKQLANYQASGGKAAGSMKVGKDTFRQVFQENDLFLNTSHVLARAYADGNIYVRFKIEGETAYAEALDWLNDLLEKDYADINNGFSLSVRFLIKPIFIKALANACDKNEGWGFAKNSCHAFFARAVQYPALREKVKRYAELALNLYDWYKDIEGEENCVPGTFAACALAFAEEKYVPMIGLFGRNSDDEHQYIQLLVAGPLFKQYGATPEVAAALFDIQSSNGQDGNISLNKALLTTPACLAGVLEHVHQGDLGEWAPHALNYHVPGYVEKIWGKNVKSNLKKFRQFAEGTATPEDRNIFVNFYNFYKKYAALRDEVDYGEDLEGIAETPKDTEILKDIVVPAYTTEPLLSRQDAKKAGWAWETEYQDDPRGFFFFPVCIDDPELLDFVLAQWKTGCARAYKELRATFSWSETTVALGQWVFNTEKCAHAWGFLLTDGENKPVVLYGVLNTTQLCARWCKRPFKTPEEAEAARQDALIREVPPKIPFTGEERALNQEFKQVFAAVFNEHWWRASQLLPRWRPEQGRYYDAALALRVKLAQRMGEWENAAAFCDELSARRPEFAPYLAVKKATLGKEKKE